MTIQKTIIPSPIGELIAVATDEHLLLLEYTDSGELWDKLSKIHTTPITEWENALLKKVKIQLEEYFSWKRKQFDLPLLTRGTDFQKKSWEGLQKIPYGETKSYQEQASIIDNPKAVRAIWWANHNNPIVIIIPCHRVIGKSGKLVGYGGGIHRKIWLLEHEKNNI